VPARPISSGALRQTVQALVRLGIRRELLLAWAVAAGHERKYVGKLLCECFSALGIRQRRPGAGRRTAPSALLLLAFAQELFGGKAGKCLRAARRAANGLAGAQLAAQGPGIIPGLELYSPAVTQFATRLSEITKMGASHEPRTT